MTDVNRRKTRPGVYRRLAVSSFVPFLTIVFVIFALRSAVADWNDVPSGSMRPTIVEGDRILVNKLAYDVRVPFTSLSVVARGAPQRGDIIVFFSPDTGTRMVKRVIGVPGDQVALRGNRVYIDGRALPYRPDPAPVAAGGGGVLDEILGGRRHRIRVSSAPSPGADFGPAVVPEDHYFVMGDNRDNSHDSRWFGFVPRAQIVGRAGAVALSLDPKRNWRPRWQRFGQPLW